MPGYPHAPTCLASRVGARIETNTTQSKELIG